MAKASPRSPVSGPELSRYTVLVRGMDCSGCAATIERTLCRLEGVQEVRADVMAGSVDVAFSEALVTRATIRSAISTAGYQPDERPSPGTIRTVFQVHQALEADLASALQTALERLPGAHAVEVDIVRRRLAVSGPVDRDAARRSLARLGVPAAILGDFRRPLPTGRLAAAGISGIALLIGLIASWAGAPPLISLIPLAISTIAGGWFVGPRALAAIRRRAFDMSVLMSIAALGAWLIREPEEAAVTLFLFAIAELLEARSMGRARQAIASLIEVAPSEATMIANGEEIRVPAASLTIGDVVLVKPGQKIPVDGVVIEGASTVNQAPITGESIPVEKEIGATVFAGSLNQQGVLLVRSTRTDDDTTLARIIHAVEAAQATKAPSQRFIDRFARVYTPIIMVIATLIAVVPPLLDAGTWNEWIYRGLATLVAACPCALVISTPVAIVSGLAGAARRGILIKGGAHLERAARLTSVYFDKTGTLTEGDPSVTDLIAVDGWSEERVLRMALGIERSSEHPLAAAILRFGRDRGVTPPPVSEFQALPGRGARASVAGVTGYLGNERLLSELGADPRPVVDWLRRFEAEGKTAVVVIQQSVGGIPTAIGALAIADRPRARALSALADLAQAGIERVALITGDNLGTARAIARELRIDQVHAQLLPEEKVAVIREAESRGERVAFVGDGVNDAPAIAAASVGIAMGATGADVALETADIALMGDDLGKVGETMRFARRVMGIIRQNVVLSIAVKSVFLVLAATGFATLWMAVAADMGISLIVVANGLRAAAPSEAT